MWYDLVVLGILLYFAVRGASRGIISQLAGIAGIALCLVFAESISAAIGPMISLQPPLNHWVVMFGSYLLFSFIAFGFARVMNDWIEQAKLETFNRHLGMLFGAAKGVVLCLVLTFFLVTLSPAARESLKMSKSAHVAAIIMDRIHPIMPEKLNVALQEYLNIHALDTNDANLQAHDGTAPGTTTGTPAIPQGPAQPGPAPLWNDAGWTLPAPDATTTTSGQPAQHPIDQFLSRLPASVTDDVKLTIARSLGQTPPDQWPLAQAKLLEALAAATPQQVQERLIAGGRRSVVESLAGWTEQFLMPTREAPSTTPSRPTQPSPFPNQPATTQPTPSRTTPIDPRTNPGWNPGSSIPPTTTPGGQMPAPLAGQVTRREQMLVEISQAYSSIPPVQLQVRQDIGRRLSGLPDTVSAGVVEDWWRDLRAPQSPDPDPGTNANSPLETRILRQLDRHRVPVDRLSLEVQDRLEGATLQ